MTSRKKEILDRWKVVATFDPDKDTPEPEEVRAAKEGMVIWLNKMEPTLSNWGKIVSGMDMDTQKLLAETFVRSQDLDRFWRKLIINKYEGFKTYEDFDIMREQEMEYKARAVDDFKKKSVGALPVKLTFEVWEGGDATEFAIFGEDFLSTVAQTDLTTEQARKRLLQSLKDKTDKELGKTYEATHPHCTAQHVIEYIKGLKSGEVNTEDHWTIKKNNLRQGIRPVLEYYTDCTQTFRFYQQHVKETVSVKEQIKIFRDGLKRSIARKLVGMSFNTLDEVFKRAQKVEADLQALHLKEVQARGRADPRVLSDRERSRDRLYCRVKFNGRDDLAIVAVGETMLVTCEYLELNFAINALVGSFVEGEVDDEYVPKFKGFFEVVEEIEEGCDIQIILGDNDSEEKEV